MERLAGLFSSTPAQVPLAFFAAMAATLIVVGVLYARERLARRRLAARLSTVHAKLEEIDAGALPGVLNRQRFDRALDEAVHRADAGDAPLSVLFVNIDNFGTVNETCGYGCGDHVIQQVAERLVARVGRTAPVARLGGDEFVVLAACTLDGARTLAAELVRALARPYLAGGRRDMMLSCSVGIAAYPEHASKSRLLGHANSAMRQVKLAGGGDYMVFEPRMAIDLREQAELLHDLRSAVTKGELELYYQPKVDAASLQITSVEALLRWHHPRRGMVSPAVFIPIAERFGLIGAIGDWVIEDACRQAAAWRDTGLHMRVAINISPYQMRQDDLADGIVGALRRHGLSPARFTCEITESVAMEDTKVTQRTFARLGEAGLHVSIDDFGVGQASLSYLRRLPATELKIDGSFVRDLETSADARSIVDAVVRLAHALELRVVAEGVETERQCELLVQMGCDELQGYLFARPMSAAALGVWALADESDAPERFRPSLFDASTL